MAEFNSAKELNIDFSEVYDTDVMTGDRDRRMYLYYQLVGSLRRAVSVDIIVSFLMESGVKMLLERITDSSVRVVENRTKKQGNTGGQALGDYYKLYKFFMN